MLSLSSMIRRHPITSVKYFFERIGLKRKTDRDYINYVFERKNDGLKLNLDDPITYTDKLNWMKLYDRRDIYTAMVDKIKVKNMVSSIIGSKYVIPVLNSETSGKVFIFSDLDDLLSAVDEFPNQFVIKTNHDCGGVIICKDKNSFNPDIIKDVLEKRLKTNFYFAGREWPYKNVERKVFCEKYIENLSDNNYKFFCLTVR